MFLKEREMTIAHLKGELFEVSKKCFNLILHLKNDVQYYHQGIYISLNEIRFLVFMRES